MSMFEVPRRAPRRAIGALLAIAACAHVPSTAPTAARRLPAALIAATAPPQVVAWIDLPSLDHGLDGAAAFVGTFPLPPLDVAHLDLAVGGLIGGAPTGLRVDRPVRLLVAMEPGAADAAYALVGTIGDAAALPAGRHARGEALAIVGPRPLLDAAAPWALASYARATPPSLPTLHVVPEAAYRQAGRALLAGMASGIAEAGDQAVAAPLGAAFQAAVVATMAEASAIDVRLDATGARLRLDLDVTARPGTALARFFAAQRPVAPALASRITAPHDGAAVVARLRVGPYRAAVGAGVARWLRTLRPELSAGDVGAVVDGLGATLTGDVAIGDGVMLLGLTDAPRARALFEDDAELAVLADALIIPSDADSPAFGQAIAVATGADADAAWPSWPSAALARVAASGPSLIAIWDVSSWGFTRPGLGDPIITATATFAGDRLRLHLDASPVAGWSAFAAFAARQTAAVAAR